jgi:uncharacterized protein (TIGR03435 family)
MNDRRRVSKRLSPGIKRLLSVVGLITAIVPFAVSQANPIVESNKPTAPAPVAPPPEFEVVSVKPHGPLDRGWKLRFTPDGYYAEGVTAQKLIQEAYGIFEADRISGLPSWGNSQKYDIEAKFSDSDLPAFQKLDVDQRRLTIQGLLASRFKLKVRHEVRELPVYDLIVAKDQPKFQETRPDEAPIRSTKGFGGLITRSGPGQLTVKWETMSHFAEMLSMILDRQVIDTTGLKGHYDFALDWAPDSNLAAGVGSSNETSTTPDLSGPSIFTALQEQLGLKLKAQKGPVEVLVIAHIEQPSAN